MTNKKVLMPVCNYFNPDNRVFRAADVLQENGFEVQVLAYHKNDLPKREILGHGFLLTRIQTNIRFSFSKKLKNVLHYWQFKRKAKKIADSFKPDFVHCHDYNTLFLGIYCKKKYHSTLIYDNHEYFQDLNYIHRYPLFIRKWIAKYERKALRSAVDEMIVVSPGIAKMYSRFFAKPIHLVRNIPDMEWSKTDQNLPPEVRVFLERQKSEKRKLLLYLGTNSQRGRGLDFTFELLRILPDEFGLVVFGSKSDRELAYLENKYKALEDKNRFAAFKSLTHRQLSEVAQYCFLGLSLIEPIYLSYKFSLPNKLFEYLGMGLPVLSSEIPDQKQLVEEYKIGLVIPFDPENAKEKIMHFEPNREAISLAQKEFTWQKEKKIYLSIYKSPQKQI